MTLSSAARLAFAALFLLTGCRSEKVAFQFQPAKSVASAATPAAPAAETSTVAQPVPEPTKAPAAESAPATASRAQASRPVAANQVKRPLQLTRPQLRLARAETQRVRAWQAKRSPRRAADDEADVLHVVLGSMLIIGGIILGLLLGGWLGLGVGAAVVILGYYFLVMGIGGPHAWKEIFQEFFNM